MLFTFAIVYIHLSFQSMGSREQMWKLLVNITANLHVLIPYEVTTPLKAKSIAENLTELLQLKSSSNPGQSKGERKYLKILSELRIKRKSFMTIEDFEQAIKALSASYLQTLQAVIQVFPLTDFKYSVISSVSHIKQCTRRA